MPGLPIGIPAVPEAITKRIWDFVVQGIADAFKYHDKKDIARRIEALRTSPNLPSLMTDAVQEGWQYWLTHSHEHAIIAAVKRDLQDHLPTLVGVKLLEALQRPITRHDVEEYLATWFTELHSLATLGKCRDAARDLLDRILQATLSAPALQDLLKPSSCGMKLIGDLNQHLGLELPKCASVLATALVPTDMHLCLQRISCMGLRAFNRSVPLSRFLAQGYGDESRANPHSDRDSSTQWSARRWAAK